ncbi:hypothetical protein [Salipiger thiooxidans]|uniref:hypothetical protein n=1 Tax=Salipiger thiooxidans TaxID=282683 RepID=UPI001CF95454|nr:hypothetical protein [Salipiger thiooxidans]
MSFGPSDIGSVLQGVGSWANAFAIGFAAWLGTRTFATWREQKLTERQMSEAERILIAVYEVRRALSAFRSPVIFPQERRRAEKQLKEDDGLPDREPQREGAIKAETYRLRSLETLDSRRSLDACKPMAKALFGEELESAIEDFEGLFVEVNRNLILFVQFSTTHPPDLKKRIEDTIWEAYPTPQENAMDKVIASKIQRIEGACLPLLSLNPRRG